MLGYGLIESRGSRLSLLDSGVFKAPAGDSLDRRLLRIVRELRGLVEKHKPDAAAVEDVFVKTDPRAALAVGQARGAILVVLAEASLSIASYAPATIKRAVAGNGRASKEQVAKMVATILGERPLGETSDATDAVAVAITHAFRARSQALGNA